MDTSSAPQVGSKQHSFVSADSTIYKWFERQETAMTLEEEEIIDLRQAIENMSDEAIQNDVSGNGMKMGVPVQLSRDRLDAFLEVVLNVIKFKKIRLTSHALDRLQDDLVNGAEHPNFRGWLSEEDVHHCVCTINRVDGVRLTVNKATINSAEVHFNQSLALEVRGQRPDGIEGTLALAIIESNRIRIITLL
ncbi:hypothetical protein [Tumebacillus permanentifrigoris]|uniref:Uncharacterized protein n=1 Tax=Tumebacillus permanentifrigoris TaxID=378543 RepID=A0A316DIN4_9BACL|nr:hypothetical protein [Tumebacillus permanentifrigoris]PWK16493.1 hypothetical protein C7459_101357 [Tumebacillus permanentifrigoris]